MYTKVAPLAMKEFPLKEKILSLKMSPLLEYVASIVYY